MSSTTTPPIASLRHTVSSHNSDVTAVTFNSKVLATSSGDKTVRLWSLDDFSELPSSPLCGHSYAVNACKFSPFGTQLATCSTDGKCILWDIVSGDKLCVLEHPSRSSLRVCRFSPNSALLATGSDDESLCIWDISSKTILKSFGGTDGHEATVTAATFSPDGTLLISGSPTGDLRIWDACYGHGKHLTIALEAHDLGVTACEFSPTYGSAGNLNGEVACQIHFLLASCGYDNNVKLWDVVGFSGSKNINMQLRSTLTGHDQSVMSISFSPSGKILASGAADKSIRLWEPLRGKLLQVLEAHSRYVTSCAFSMDGTVMATGSNDKLVKIWTIAADESHTGVVSTNDVLVDIAGASAPPAERKAVEQWSVDDVSTWATEVGMGQYAESFKANAIDGTELLTLKDSSLLNALGITALGHRNKLLRAIEQIQLHPCIQPKAKESHIPDEYSCPITREVMKDPVIASDGYTYERAAILSWMSSGKTQSPMTNAVLGHSNLTPNRSLKMLIQRNCENV